MLLEEQGNKGNDYIAYEQPSDNIIPIRHAFVGEGSLTSRWCNTLRDQLQLLQQDPLVCPNLANWQETLPCALSAALGCSSVLFVGLSLNDFQSGWIRWVFPLPSFLVNYVRMLEVDQIALTRYLIYLQILTRLFREPKKFRNILNLQGAPNKRIVTKVFFFLTKEGIKLTTIYYISDLLSALVEEVSWLNSKAMRFFLHFATMVMLEPPVHDRLQDLRFPKLNNYDIVKQEIRKFRSIFSAILEQNKKEALSNINCPDERLQELWQLINDSSFQSTKLWSALISGNKKNVSILQSPLIAYLKHCISISFMFLYGIGESANYRATWTDPDIGWPGRVGSVLGDFVFGIFLAFFCADAVIDVLSYGFKNFFCENALIHLSIVAFSLACAGLTIPSALSVSKEQDMPFLAGTIGVSLGTLFDNSAFLMEILFKKTTLLAFKNPQNRQHSRAAIIYLYQIVQKQLDTLSDASFLNVLSIVLCQQPYLLDSYDLYIHDQLGWSVDYTIPNIVTILSKPASVAMLAINRSNHFGYYQRMKELAAAAIAFTLASAQLGLDLLPPLKTGTALLFCHCLAAVSVSTALAINTYCFPKQKQKNLAPIENMPQANSAILPLAPVNPFHRVLHSSIKTLLYSVTPLLVRYCILLISRWSFHYIFTQGPDNSQHYGEITGDIAMGISAATLVHQHLSQHRR